MAFTIDGVSYTRAQVDAFITNMRENLRMLSSILKRLDAAQRELDGVNADQYEASELANLAIALADDVDSLTITAGLAAEACIALTMSPP